MFCPQCGESNPENAMKCSRCGYELIPPLNAKPYPEKPPQMPLPSGTTPTSAMAIWSLVLGIIGFITCFVPVFGIFAAILGGVALSRIKNSQGRLAGSGPATVGLVLGIASLCLCLIVAILAAIAIPNFLEAQTRSKVARAKNDMRSLATAIESYYVDNNKYPLSSSDPSTNLYGCFPKPLGRFMSHLSTFRTGGKAMMLTTPVAYMSYIPNDPFAPLKGTPFCYYADPTGSTWILWSAGPDNKYDLTAQNIVNILDPRNPNMASDPTLQSLTFDPTNGTRSPGDIWRVKQ